MADGSPVEYRDGWVQEELRELKLRISGHQETITLDITNIKYDLVLGIEWLQRHNPTIN